MKKSLALRFSLRSLLLAITGVAVVFGTWVARTEQQRRAVASLWNIEFCEIGYAFDTPPGCERLATPPGSTYRPRWIDKAIGIDSLHSVIDVTIPATRLDEAMEHLRRLP